MMYGKKSYREILLLRGLFGDFWLVLYQAVVMIVKLDIAEHKSFQTFCYNRGGRIKSLHENFFNSIT